MKAEETGDLWHVLYVGEYCVLESVAGVSATTAFTRAQVLSEPGIESFKLNNIRYKICMWIILKIYIHN